MKLHELKPADGSKRNRRRVGRGNGSGMGNYATRGMKGQKSRSGGSIKRGFAGGQLSMIKGLPMLRGFTIDIALTVKAHKFSEQAQNAIENAGGKIELL